MEIIVGYGYEIWYDGNCIREKDEYESYDTEEEAREGAMNEIDFIIDYEEGYSESDRDDLEIVIVDITEMLEEE